MKKRFLYLITLALVLVCLIAGCQEPRPEGLHWQGEDLQAKLHGPCYIYNVQENAFEENSSLTVDIDWTSPSGKVSMAVEAYPQPEWKHPDPQDPNSGTTRVQTSSSMSYGGTEKQVLVTKHYTTIYETAQDEVGFAPVWYKLVQYRRETGTAIQITCYNEDGSCEKMVVALYGFASQEEARQFAVKYEGILTEDPRPANVKPEENKIS